MSYKSGKWTQRFIQFEKYPFLLDCLLSGGFLPHLGQKPRVLLRQSIKVCLRRHSGIAESVLDSCRCADVLVEELLSRLLGDGFGRHDCSGK